MKEEKELWNWKEGVPKRKCGICGTLTTRYKSLNGWSSWSKKYICYRCHSYLSAWFDSQFHKLESQVNKLSYNMQDLKNRLEGLEKVWQEFLKLKTRRRKKK